MEAQALTSKEGKNLASTAYVLTVLSVLGVFAAISAVLLAWPALAYLGAKMM
ncbi:hypothetical protein JCM30471_26280 [Desulfuromonas carbonis]|uniref:hypothetical protein n=1 Tax=Desulfuromonas sp. DDH964 TaxID=1823759 RepID=UPI00078B59FE|nr:hypothetical protein [Desulfuromonas sp. DDH964]AMV70820.1 hypothetical protein DBW_0418 [Desulfuromonas sp. DDH964]